MLGPWLQLLTEHLAGRIPDLAGWQPRASWYAADDSSGGLAFIAEDGRHAIAVNVGGLGIATDEAPSGRVAELFERIVVHELAHVVDYLRHGVLDDHGHKFTTACTAIADALGWPAPWRSSEASSSTFGHPMRWPLELRDCWSPPHRSLEATEPETQEETPSKASEGDPEEATDDIVLDLLDPAEAARLEYEHTTWRHGHRLPDLQLEPFDHEQRICALMQFPARLLCRPGEFLAAYNRNSQHAALVLRRSRRR